MVFLCLTLSWSLKNLENTRNTSGFGLISDVVKETKFMLIEKVMKSVLFQSVNIPKSISSDLLVKHL